MVSRVVSAVATAFVKHGFVLYMPNESSLARTSVRNGLAIVAPAHFGQYFAHVFIFFLSRYFTIHILFFSSNSHDILQLYMFQRGLKT